MRTLSITLIFISMFLFVSCEQTMHIEASKTAAPRNVALIWNYNSPEIRSGETIPFAFSNGVPSYTTNANGIGTFDNTTLNYSTAINQAPANHTIYATDSAGKNGSNQLSIAGFQVGNKITYPESFGDQNYVTSSVTLANGNIFISSVIIDSPGWERWVINRTTDLGLTWTEVDQYIPTLEGESHPMAMVAKNNDLYVCGYMWDSATPVYNSEWIVRKSTNSGSSWTISDQFAITPNQNHVCYDIALHSASGNLYTVGYEALNGIIRESTDDGATWNTIFSSGAAEMFTSVKVSPAGVIWAVAENGDLWKGTETLGVWNFVNSGNITGAISNTTYALRGDLEIVTENEVYFSGRSGAWNIARTTDGGASWVDVYTGPANSAGQDIKRLSSGEFVSIGYFITVPRSYVILHSPDGITWNIVYQENTITQDGVTLTEANDGSIMAFGSYNDISYQIINVRSVDGGLNWAQRGIIFFKQQLYTYLNDFHRDIAGNLWTTGETMLITFGESNPWVTMKSTDNGTTWTESDVFTDPVNYFTAQGIGSSLSGDVYVSGTDNTDLLIRKTSDSGATWTEVNRVPGSVWRHHVTVASDGTVYMTGTNFANCNIHKGVTNGTVWSISETFPVLPGYTQCTPLSLEAFSDGSLWFSVAETSGGAVNQTAIYRSTDDGVTFTEVFRENFSNNYQTIKRLPNGDIYAQSLFTVMRTSDNGATWVTVYDGLPTLNSVKDFIFDNDGRIYVLDNNSRVWAVNQFDGSWFTTYDYDLVNVFLYPSILQFADCGNATGVCAIAQYDEPGYGTATQLVNLVAP